MPDRHRRWAVVTLVLGGLLVVGLLAGGISLVRQRLDQQRRDPEPVVVDVIAPFPAASAEEVERQVTIPLEVSLAGMPGLETTRSQSLFGLALVRTEFAAGTDAWKHRQEVINRLQLLQQLPAGVVPQLAALSPGPIFRYTVRSPGDRVGRDVYTLNDLRAVQDWILEREFRRVPRVADVTSSGGTVKRYEIHPDPERLRKYGITLQQLETAIAGSNDNLGEGFRPQGDALLNVRGVGLFGDGQDPVQQVLELKNPEEAAARLRAEEQRRLRQLRLVTLATVNNVPVRVEHVVEGGPLGPGEEGARGVVVGYRPRLTRVGHSRAVSRPDGQVDRTDEDDTVQGAVWLRSGEELAPARRDLEARIKELNEGPGRLPPGVQIEPAPNVLRSGSGDSSVWIRGTLPANVSLEKASETVRRVRTFLMEQPEVEAVLSQIGDSDEVRATPAYQHLEFFVGLRSQKDKAPPPGRRRTWPAFLQEIQADLNKKMVGVDWLVSWHWHDPLAAPFTPSAGEKMVKLFGPGVEELEQLAEKVKAALRQVEGIEKVRTCPVKGPTRLELAADPEKCARWGVSAATVRDVIRLVTAGKVVTRMVEGEKTFEVLLRWPDRLCRSENDILNLAVDLPVDPLPPGRPGDQPVPARPRLRLQDLVRPVGNEGDGDARKDFHRPGAAVIYRENGKRMISVTFRVEGRAVAEAVAEAREKTAALFQPPFRAEWDNMP
jgi:Cu/Ag efflux pump CusA